MRIAEVAFPVPLHRAFHYEVPFTLAPGTRVRVPFGPQRTVGMVLSVFEGEPERPLKKIESILDPEPILTPEMVKLARWLSGRYSAPIGECVKAVLPAFVKSGQEPAPWIRPTSQPSPRPSFTLTAGQDQALKLLLGRIDSHEFSAALLYGVPASGKTEVYLRLIRRAIEGGGQALFLVPEISLTAPFFEEFKSSLDVPVVLWHSRLGARERRLAWLGLRRGEVKVVVGARSASMLPFQDLRVAVIDEEQDESFKQEEQSPLYHAREVVLHRARQFKALAVLGSATPSLEAWELARQKELELVAMPDRVSSVSRPKVGLVALPLFGCLSEPLLSKLKDRLGRREQSILLVNRRGFATLVMCKQCGWVERCADCGVAKIQHEEGGVFFLRCHHCEKKEPMPAQCPKCSKPALRVTGTGTQKVVAELKKLLPGARVLRMDRDTVSKEGKEEARIYEKFLAREADVLVGTKLVAKSFHFPDVTLVGVVDADTMLNMPDFRASERTMQLLAQVAGRSGRAEKPGEVLLQTLYPDHIAISKTVDGDYSAFAEGELSTRRELGYPPFSVLVRLVWTGKEEPKVSEAAHAAAEKLREQLMPLGHEVVGPAPTVIRLASGKFRYHALMKVGDSAQLMRALEAARAAECPSGIKLKINVDPYDLF
ncbi:MAG: primosomal protein N' [Elusimicrobia bacterium]|nr:primosomal protein N' [Elusimicrobiota bacterium]